jgi:hypothetical protein
MGWSNANGEFQFYSNATVSNEVVSGTLGNVNANFFIGTFSGNVTGNLVNGNSNVTVAANANVQIAANGNSIATFTSSGDGNLTTTGVNVAGYINATGNIFTSNIVQNASTYDTRISLGSSSGIIAITSNGNSTQFSPSHVYYNVGNYSVGLTMITTSGCIDTLYMMQQDLVNVYPSPNAGFSVNPDKVDICNSEVRFIDQSSGGNQYYYIFDNNSFISQEQNFVHTYVNTGTDYPLQVVTNQYGCSDSARATVFVEPFSLYIPNAFIPDDDGVNDDGKDNGEDERMMIIVAIIVMIVMMVMLILWWS